MKGDTAVAVDAVTMNYVHEIAEYEKIPKKSVVSNAIRFYYNYWNESDFDKGVGL